jgi:hypothetical protein
MMRAMTGIQMGPRQLNFRRTFRCPIPRQVLDRYSPLHGKTKDDPCGSGESRMPKGLKNSFSSSIR